MASRWYARANRYRELSRDMLGRSYYPEACFFAQQAVEFYLKGRLIELTGSRLYTHSIVTLLRQVASVLNKPLSDDIIRCAKLLTEQYIGSRYPDARMLDYDRADAEDCVKCMEMVMNYV